MKKSIIALFVVLFLSAAFFGLTQAFSIVGDGETVYMPEYSSVWCDTCGSQEFIDGTPLSFDGKGDTFVGFTCPSYGEYVPRGCEFNIEVKSGIGESAVYVCNSPKRDREILSDWNKEKGTFSSGGNVEGCAFYSESKGNLQTNVERTFVLPQSGVIYIGSEVAFEIEGQYQPYCLRTLNRGMLTSKSTCEATELISESKYTDFEGQFVPSGRENAIQNVVIGYSGVIDAIDVVENPETGQSVYLQQFGNNIQSCEILEGNDGRKFVDLQSCENDATFVCIPSQAPTEFLCEGGLELNKVVEAGQCSGEGLLGYNIIGEQKCAVSCNNGNIKIGQCEDIIGYNDGKVDPVPTQDGSSGFGILYVALFVLAAIATMVFVKYRKGGKKK
jgi:hypothetical protein